MKILFLHQFRVFAGAERQLVELASGLAGKGHDVTVVTFYRSRRVEDQLVPAGARVISLEKSGRWDLIRFGWRLARTLRQERSDIVHGYLGFANALLVLLRPIHRAKVVWGVRSSDIDVTRYDRLNQIDAYVETALRNCPSLIISNSERGRDVAIQRGFPADKLVVIPNGVDLHRFQRSEVDRSRVRTEWGVEPDQSVVGRIGRISPQKDFETFLRAAAIVSRDHPNARFALITSDPLGIQSDLRAFANQCGLGDRLIWIADQDDMPSVYSALDLCVSSSAFGEGVPNVLVEAMACGVPCVTTNVGDSATTVGAFGDTVPPADPVQLAAGITCALGRPADRDLLRRHVADLYSMDSLIRRTESTLAGLLDRPIQAGVAERPA